MTTAFIQHAENLPVVIELAKDICAQFIQKTSSSARADHVVVAELPRHGQLFCVAVFTYEGCAYGEQKYMGYALAPEFADIDQPTFDLLMKACIDTRQPGLDNVYFLEEHDDFFEPT